MVAIVAGAVLATIAVAGSASAGTTVTLKDVSGVDNGNGTASYTIQIKGSKKCRKGRKISLEAGSAPGTPPRKLGSGKTNGKGKASFTGPVPSESQRITLHLHSTQLISGALFILLGLMMLEGQMGRINGLLVQWSAVVDERMLGFQDWLLTTFSQ